MFKPLSAFIGFLFLSAIVAQGATTAHRPGIVESTLTNVNFANLKPIGGPLEGLLGNSPGLWNNYSTFPSNEIVELVTAHNDPSPYRLFVMSNRRGGFGSDPSFNDLQDENRDGFFSILDLEAGIQYELVLYVRPDQPTVFQFPDLWFTTLANGNGSITEGVELGDHVRLTRTANEFGQIAFESSGLSGFQIGEVVPEPSSVLLVSLSGLLLLRRRR